MNRIKELRIHKGISQRVLATDMYVNQTAVSQWERGATNPSTEMALRLAEYFGVSVDYLLGVESDQLKKSTEQNLSDELTDPLDAEILSIFHSLTAEDREFFVEMMRRRGKM